MHAAHHNLEALNPVQRQRHAVLMGLLDRMLLRLEPLPNGATLHFTAGASVWMLVAEFANLERLCAPSIGFTLERDADSGAVRLQVTGPHAERFVATRWTDQTRAD
jgi:hypothetical protein